MTENSLARIQIYILRRNNFSRDEKQFLSIFLVYSLLIQVALSFLFLIVAFVFISN